MFCLHGIRWLKNPQCTRSMLLSLMAFNWSKMKTDDVQRLDYKDIRNGLDLSPGCICEKFIKGKVDAPGHEK